MKSISWKQVIVYLLVLAVAYFLFSLADGSNPFTSPIFTSSDSQQNSQSQTSFSSGDISINDLPLEGRTTLQLIKNGGPFPYSKDGTVFSNYEGLLPKKANGYYREYTVITPGSPDRGARRIVAGENKDYYYTSDHYSSFKLIRD